MRGAVIILYFVGFLFKKTGCSVHETQLKIIGGGPIDIRYRPFMLSLHSADGFQCGASILSRKWGITALHCLDSLPSSQYYVRAGSNKADKGGSVHEVTNIHVYNDTYVSSSTLPYHDIALFEVKPLFRFSKTVRPIHLPAKFHKIYRKLFISGWGSTSVKDEHHTPFLMGTYLQYVPFKICINTNAAYKKLVKSDYHLCYGSPGKDACYGDSGGPLASNKTLYGIVSFGDGCGKVTGVYVRLSYYREWIKNITNL